MNFFRFNECLTILFLSKPRYVGHIQPLALQKSAIRLLDASSASARQVVMIWYSKGHIRCGMLSFEHLYSVFGSEFLQMSFIFINNLSLLSLMPTSFSSIAQKHCKHRALVPELIYHFLASRCCLCTLFTQKPCRHL